MGPYLSQPIKDKEIEEEGFENFHYISCSMQGWRNTMEDSHIAQFNIQPGIHVFGVFDGHGGKEVAIFNESFIKKNYSQALKEIFLKMDQLLDTDQGKQELQNILGQQDKTDFISAAGCTANVILIAESKVYCANAGDSKSILCQLGTVIEMSKDHKPEDEIESNRIQNAGGFVLEGRINGNLNLSRAIGDMDYKNNTNLKPEQQLIISTPDIYEMDLTEKDEFILIGCDGIWETKTIEFIISTIRDNIKAEKNKQQIMEDIFEELIAPSTTFGYGCDNMSSVLIQLNKIV